MKVKTIKLFTGEEDVNKKEFVMRELQERGYTSFDVIDKVFVNDELVYENIPAKI